MITRKQFEDELLKQGKLDSKELSIIEVEIDKIIMSNIAKLSNGDEIYFESPAIPSSLLVFVSNAYRKNGWIIGSKTYRNEESFTIQLAGDLKPDERTNSHDL